MKGTKGGQQSGREQGLGAATRLRGQAGCRARGPGVTPGSAELPAPGGGGRVCSLINTAPNTLRDRS